MQYYQSLTRPSELFALFKFVSTTKSQKFDDSTNVGWCYNKLVQTSRSFALVIQQLHESLKDAVMVFYLVLRGLDTIEDDMSFSRDRKIEMLKSFHSYLDLPGWTFEECGEGNEKELLQNFDKVIEVYKSLDVQYQEVIQDITQKMGNGMVEFLNSEVDTLEDWNRYCYYVAGLVGVGLSKLFAISKLEDEEFNSSYLIDLSISMGLFLQKTNIIRDYREDIDEKRIFWPKQIWSIYSKKLEHFRDQNYSLLAVHCLNHLITNALEHVPDVLGYLAKLKNRETFAFCAIPQAMAIATFAVCYNNPDVFFGAVKIRRGESAKIFNNLKGGITDLYRIFLFYASVIESKIPADDPNAAETKAIIKKIKDICEEQIPKESGIGMKEVVIGATVVASAAYLYTVYAKKANALTL